MKEQQWAFLTIPKQQLIEIHRALLMRFIMEDRIRHEQGLESLEYPPFLEHIEQLMGIGEDQAHQLFHQVEDELWQYSWYNYTDEWAYFRAKQEVTKELGAKAKRMRENALEDQIEQRYEKEFERYVKEVDMSEEIDGKKQKKFSRVSKKQ